MLWEHIFYGILEGIGFTLWVVLVAVVLVYVFDYQTKKSYRGEEDAARAGRGTEHKRAETQTPFLEARPSISSRSRWR